MTDSKISDLTSVVSSEAHDDFDIDDEPLSDEDVYVPEKTTVKRMKVVSVHKSYSDYTLKERKTLPYINKYELAKVLGVRAQQIAMGMKPLVSTKGKTNIYEIVEAEYKERVLPLFLRRHLPDNTHEDWRLTDFVNI